MSILSLIKNNKENKKVKIVLFTCGFLLLFLSAINLIDKNLEIFQGHLIFKKDLIQDYLMAKAVQNNLNPYLSIDQLSKKILGLPKDSIPFLHPSPHPPSSILIFYPFVFFSFQQTALIWFALDLLLLFVFLKESWKLEKLHPLSKKWTFILYLTIITSNIFYISSSLGQINLLLLYLFFRFYLSWKKNNIFAGIFLGIIFGLKLMGWPFIIFLALKRKFKIIVVSGISFLVANIISLFLISWQTFLDYYLKEILQVGKRYASYHNNVSLFSLGQKLFSGQSFFDENIGTVFFQPLILKEQLVFYFNIFILIVIVYFIHKVKKAAFSFEISFSIILLLSLFANPIAWEHYLIISLLPIILTWNKLKQLNFPDQETNFFLLFNVLLYAGNFFFPNIIAGKKVISFFPGLLSSYPLLLACMFCFILYQLGKIEKQTTK